MNEADKNLEKLPAGKSIAEYINELEAEGQGLFTFKAQVQSWEKVRDALLACRSANLGVLYLVSPPERPLQDEELAFIIDFLVECDQLSLTNLLVLMGDKLPVPFRSQLESEAKIERKWLEEWLLAASAQEIHKYPGLPWRSFIRKIVQENGDFAESVLAGHLEESYLNDFLEKKKKVVCIFPKRWGNA